MTQSVIKQVEEIDIKEDCDEDLILTGINGSTLEVYDDDVNAHNVNAGVDKTIIIIILMMQPMKTEPITKKMAQPMRMELVQTQPMKTDRDITENPLPLTTILQNITNKIR